MIKQTSKEFRTFFLEQFTKELIKNSETAEALGIKQRLKDKIKENIQKREDERKLQHMIEKKEIIEELEQIPLKKRIKQRVRKISRGLRFIQNRIPETIKNILPVPVNLKSDLGKLNPLIEDPTIILIECSGPDTNISLKRTNGEMRTANIKLTKREINDIIKRFSQAARIPVEKGIFKAAVGKLIISAIDSSFLITKINPNFYR